MREVKRGGRREFGSRKKSDRTFVHRSAFESIALSILSIDCKHTKIIFFCEYHQNNFYCFYKVAFIMTLSNSHRLKNLSFSEFRQED